LLSRLSCLWQYDNLLRRRLRADPNLQHLSARKPLGHAAILFNAERVRAALAPLAGHEIPGKGLPFDRFTFLPGEKTARFSFENRDFILDLSSYSIQPVPLETPLEKDRHTPRFLRKADLYGPPAIYETASPDGRFFLGSADGKLYLRSTADGRREPLTEEGTKDYGWDSNGGIET
jgi:hypothetical protein